MKTLRRILSEPLAQFLIIGAAVFAMYVVVNDPSYRSAPEKIEIGPGRVAQLMETFSRTWQRPPTRNELDGLIDAFVKEEIFYREGRKLGLDTDDTVFRRRLQQKMEFLIEPDTAELTPQDGELQQYLEANREAYRVPAKVAFQQVFFDPGRRGEAAEADARIALARLRAGEIAFDDPHLGDATLLPAGMPLVSVDQVAISFGPKFAETLGQTPAGDWTGPVRSTFGLHLIRVNERSDARDPELEQVSGAVLRDWEAERSRAIADERYDALRANYDVVVEMPPELQESASQ